MQAGYSKKSLNMNQFIKANSASLVSSFCDYVVAILLKELMFVPAFFASIIGTLAGGVVNFFINRQWVFRSHNTSLYSQSKRYFLIWSGNLLLNAVGLYLLIDVGGLYYITAKVITSVLVAMMYNYPLQKKYVFKNN